MLQKETVKLFNVCKNPLLIISRNIGLKIIHNHEYIALPNSFGYVK